MRSTLGPAEAIATILNGAAADDGNAIAFDIKTKDDAEHTFWLHISDVAKLVSYLIVLSQSAASQKGALAPPPTQPTALAPVEALSFGVAPGRSSQEILLSIHLGPMTMCFATTPNGLASLRDLLNKILVPTGSSSSAH